MARSTRSIPMLLALLLCAGLSACTGTKIMPDVSAGASANARIEGDAKFGPLGNAVTQLERVDGHALGATQSQALVGAGRHTISVRCSVPGRGALAQTSYSFTAEAGHTYRLRLDLLSHPPGCATSLIDTDTDIVVAGPHVGD